MTDIAKFISDAKRTLKITRQENGGKNDFSRAEKDIRKFFENAASCPRSLADSIFEYWEGEYIYKSPEPQNEPTEEHLNKLAAILAFLDNSSELQELISEQDWQELGQLVNFEADELPIDLLQNLMRILVDKGAY